jgi:tetratricopeptide (TPR) repeat protein
MFNNDLGNLTDNQKETLAVIKKLKKNLSEFPPDNQISELEKEKKGEFFITLAYLLAEFPVSSSEAISVFLKALEILRLSGKNIKTASINGAIASIYYAKKDFQKAVRYYNESLKLFGEISTSINTIKERMIGIKGLGLSLLGLKDEKSGIERLLESADLCVEIPDIDNYMDIIIILKNLYADRSDWKTIISLEKKALKILESMNNQIEISYAHIEIGLSYSQLKDYNEAMIHFQKGVNAAIESGGNMLIYNGILMVAETLFHLREIDKAKEEYLKALSLIAYLDNQDEISKTSFVLLTLGTTKDEIEKAIKKGKLEKNAKK